MGERKVLNYYISSDFDASIIPKGARDRSKPIEVRTMLAFSIRCNVCGEYMYRGKKFNSKCERIENESYLGIKKFRFYIKCSVCANTIVFKTDPKNSDYEMESGATRNFEVWRDTKQSLEDIEKQREEEEKNDSMKALENRTLDNKLEMDVLDALDEIKAINKRHERVDTDKLLGSIGVETTEKLALNKDGLTEEDEALVKSIQFGKKRKLSNICEPVSTKVDSESHSSENSNSTESINTNDNVKAVKAVNIMKAAAASASTSSSSASHRPAIVLKRKKIDTETSKIANDSSHVPKKVAEVTTPVLVPKPALPLGDYGSSSSDEDS